MTRSSGDALSLARGKGSSWQCADVAASRAEHRRERWTLERRIRYAGGMSDLAYFEYKTVIPPQGSEREGTPAHYLVDVLIKHPVTGEKREEAELKRLATRGRPLR